MINLKHIHDLPKFGRVCKGLAVFIIVASIFCVVACAESVGGSGLRQSAQSPGIVSHESVVLTPDLEAGEGGWCATSLRDSWTGVCPTSPSPVDEGPFRGPIILERWSGYSSSNSGPVNQALVLTTDEVAAVSFEKTTPIPMGGDSVLPGYLHGAIVEFRGGSNGHVLGIKAPPQFPPSHFVPLNSKGINIQQSREPGPPLEFRVPSKRWNSETKAPRDLCSLKAIGVAGITFRSGRVMTAIRPRSTMRGREFVNCIRVSYLLDDELLEAYVLLDAAKPGSRPAAIPVMQPLVGHKGIYKSISGEAVARRIGVGWLVVERGAGLQQRLMVLSHLHVTFRL